MSDRVIEQADLRTIEHNLGAIHNDLQTLDSNVGAVNSNIKVVYDLSLIHISEPTRRS